MAIIKCINSESQQFKPVLTDKLVLDAVPTVNSLNGVTSDAVARAVAGASGEVPAVTENDNGKVLKAIYDAGGPAVEWGEVESGATYTAGDGIDIDAQNAVSVKAGTGLEIADVPAATTNLTCSVINTYRVTARNICAMTQTLADAMNTADGLTFTLSLPFEAAGNAFYVGVAKVSTAGSPEDYAVFGSQLSYTSGSHKTYAVASGTSITVKFSEYNSSKSSVTVSDITSNLAQYSLVILYDSDFMSPAEAYLSSTSPETTATIQSGSSVQDALCVSNPLPTSAIGDAGKVLTVDGTGAAAWATPSGGSTSFTVTSVTTGPWSILNNPDMNLIALNGTAMFEHSNPILVNIDIAFPNTNKIDLTSFGTDPVGASLFFMDDNNNEVCLPIQAYKEWYDISFRLRAVGTLVFPPCHYNRAMKLLLPSSITLTKGDEIASGVVETYRILN